MLPDQPPKSSPTLHEQKFLSVAESSSDFLGRDGSILYSRAAGEPAPNACDPGLLTKCGERCESAAAHVPGVEPAPIVPIGKDITARQLADFELTLLQSACEQSSEALFVTDSRTRFIIVNAAACRSLGYSREELLGMTPLDIDPDVTHEAIEKLLTPPGDFALETRHRAKDGRIFPVEVKGAVFETNGEKHIVALAHDITARKRMENTLRFIADPGEPNFLAALARHIGEALGVAYVVIDLLSANSGVAETIAFYAKGDIAPNVSYELAGTPCEGVAAKRTCCYPSGVQELFPKDRLLVEMGVESYAGAPLWDSTGKPLGLIAVMDTSPLADPAAATQILQLVAPRAAAELERSESDRQLRLGEQTFRSLAENLPDMVVRYDSDFRRTFLTRSHETLTGIPTQSLLGKTPVELWSAPNGPEGAAAFQAQLADVRDSAEPREWEVNWIRPDGSLGAVEVRGVPEFGSDGKVSGILTVSRNVTAKRGIDTQLRMAASVFGTAREGILITDPAGRILDANPAFTTISGYDRDEVLGKRPSLLSSGAQDTAFYQSMWSTLLAEGSWNGELTNRRKNGDLFVENLHIEAVRDEAGKVKHYVGIFSDVSQLKAHEEYLQHIAHHDALTGLPNRRLLTDRLTRAIAQAKSSGDMLAVLYFDLDGFKPINDNHGHGIGDQVLIDVGERLSRTLRAGDMVARIGGDEFVALLIGVGDTRECENTLRRLLDVINSPIAIDGNCFSLSASVGVSLYPADDSDDADMLLRYADQAMYFAKASGRNQFVFFGSQARSKIRGDNQMVHDLRHGLNQGQISVHYQPIIDVKTGRIVKAEALARWSHPVQGVISPSEFIPIAETGGLIHEIGDFVFKEAARVALSWSKCAGAPACGHPRISVNRSPRQFFGRDGVAPWVQHLIDNAIPGELLGVEITEGLLLENQPEVLAQLKQLRALGVAVSLDDFGTGYSALSYLKKFDIDYLKIDRSFVRDIVEDEHDRAIVEAIIAMAKRLGIELIAEGVETREQADLLAAGGCNLAQGFLYAEPLPEKDFLDFVLASGASC
ncbi:bifunctional diguanylate cyclase/phosphodiesterase [Methylocystis heyeri]|nr:EAL domain-containing protein [Methylocystis heyeri]